MVNQAIVHYITPIIGLFSAILDKENVSPMS